MPVEAKMEHYFCLVMEYASAMMLAGMIKDLVQWLMEDDE